MLLNITGPSSMGLFEMNAAAEIIHGVAHADANIIFGTVIDDEMGDEVKVTVIAAGFDRLDGGGRVRQLEAHRRRSPSCSPRTSRPARRRRRRRLRRPVVPALTDRPPWPRNVEALAAASPRTGADVDVLAVTKGFGVDAVEAAAAAGCRAIGENYAQELSPRRRRRAAGLEVHFIGQLQTNKVRHLAGVVDLWESVDRPRLVNELARGAGRPGPGAGRRDGRAGQGRLPTGRRADARRAAPRPG